MSQKSPFNFLHFATEWMLKNLKGSPLSQFPALWDFSKGIIFVLKFGFFRPSMLYPIFCQKRPVFFLCDFLKNLFHRSRSSVFARNETFCESSGLLKVFGTMWLTGDHQKYFRKISEFFFLKFSVLFIKVFRWERWVFCCSQLGKNGFRDLCVPHRVFFGAVKLMKFQCPFTLGSPYDIAY